MLAIIFLFILGCIALAIIKWFFPTWWRLINEP
jgi:hypothetical protein